MLQARPVSDRIMASVCEQTRLRNIPRYQMFRVQDLGIFLKTWDHTSVSNVQVGNA